ncbi:MAG: hypothetical protein SF069_05275 [Phycisphaerae bacterium]|nr:hypothetical protein [Phycisphaerae bacterium]
MTPRTALFQRRWHFGAGVSIFYPALLAMLAGGLLAVSPAAGDEPEEPDDAPLLPESVSDFEVDMRGRYAWQWKNAEGELVVLFNGEFQLTFGRRLLSANDGVVWIRSANDASAGKYQILTVYLSGDAEVREAAGTTTTDRVLLVSNLRTSGAITKSQDAHTRESAEKSDLYQRAKLDRAAVEAGLPLGVDYSTVRVPGRPRPGTREPAKPVRYQLGGIESARTADGSEVLVATGGVYFSQGGRSSDDFVEIRAESAVMFPAQSLTQSLGASAGVVTGSAPASAPSDGGGGAVEAGGGAAAAGAEGGSTPGALNTAGIADRVRAVYLEGDVVMSQGSRFVRADRLYFDFEVQRAIVLDAVMRAQVPDRAVPLYVRAAEIRQLSSTEIEASNAKITTSEFYTPHYHVGVEKLYLRNLSTAAPTTSTTPEGEVISAATPNDQLSGEYEAENTSLNIDNIPILSWPRAAGRLDQTETLIRQFNVGFDGDFGATLRTGWQLFNLLGLVRPPGVDATLRLDYFSDRGAAIGINSDYETTDNYGLVRSYFINDRGFDAQLGPLRREVHDPERDNRGRFLWRHREFLQDNWDLTLETSYVSDPNFLEIYERSEWFEGKEQETVFFLKRAVDKEVISILANWRLLDFVTQTEHLPDLEYRRIGDLVPETPLTMYHESRVGAVRYRVDDRQVFNEGRFFGVPYTNVGNTDTTLRADVRQEGELPLKFAGLNLVPFGTARGSYWDGQPLDQNGLWRGLGIYGVRGAATLARVFDDIRSELFDINRVRHIVKPNFMVWGANSNTRASRITPYDEGIETVDDFYGGNIGLQQIWQTKRGPQDRQRSVDLVTLNLEAGWFGDVQPGEISNGYVNTFRPEDSRTRNYFSGDLTYRVSDSTSVLYDFNFDLNDRSYDRHSFAFAVERNPRLSYIFGARYAGDIEMNLVGGGWNYKFSEKHISAVRLWHDIDGGELGEVAVAYIRKLPRWYAAVNFEYDNVDDDFRISLSLWPEGIPEWTLGQRRFTGLATSTGIRP